MYDKLILPSAFATLFTIAPNKYRYWPFGSPVNVGPGVVKSTYAAEVVDSCGRIVVATFAVNCWNPKIWDTGMFNPACSRCVFSCPRNSAEHWKILVRIGFSPGAEAEVQSWSSLTVRVRSESE